jgi:hypothetical protein
MDLYLLRRTFLPTATLGELLIDGVRFCYTLELPVRDGRPGSAIPLGSYRVALLDSPKFLARAHEGDAYAARYAHAIPRLLGVPDREGILIHWGNWSSDTEGCILVGETQSETGFVGNSRDSFDALHQRLAAATLAEQPVWLHITGEPQRVTTA